MIQIAREIRLRDIGGIIVVDFIDMEDECELDVNCYSCNHIFKNSRCANPYLECELDVLYILVYLFFGFQQIRDSFMKR